MTNLYMFLSYEQHVLFLQEHWLSDKQLTLLLNLNALCVPRKKSVCVWSSVLVLNLLLQEKSLKL